MRVLGAVKDMRITDIFLFVCVALALFAGHSDYASAAGTRGDCTCHVSDNDGTKDGAVVANATACLQRVNSDDRWCEFEILALENQAETQRIVGLALEWLNTGDSGKFEAFLVKELDAFSKNLGERYKQLGLKANSYPADHTEKIIGIIRQNKGILFDCLKHFEVREPKQFPGDSMRCHVGEVSGWLNIAIPVEGYLYIISIRSPKQ